jgi:feruloyl esterase
MEAWRYPDDYDGIVAGAPAAPWTRVITAMAWNIHALDAPPAVQLTPAKLKLISDATLARCDALDGVKDGLIENPRACHFDPGVLQCKAGASADCLSAAELTALRAIYQGPRTRDGRQISAGPAVGGESVEWNNWITGPKASHRQMPPEYFGWMVYGDPTWTLAKFNLDRDFAAAQRRTGAILNSDNPDLRPFLKHGGKLILYHGWADAALPPDNTVAYYEAVKRRAPAAAGQLRLFMIPGMAHCGGGIGPNQVDWVGEIDRWSESGAAPERIIVSKLSNPLAPFTGQPIKVIQSRPLCAWPKQARWTGTGSTDEAANFRCVTVK